MKCFFTVLIGSVVSFAQIPNAYFGSGYSVPEMFSKSLNNYHLIPTSPATHFSLMNNIFTDVDSTNQRMDSLVANAIAGDGWKFLFQYNNSNNIIEQLILCRLPGSEWENCLKDEYFYDEDQKLVLWVMLGLNGTSWDSLGRFNYEYNTQGQLTQYIFQNYTSNSWENYSRNSFVYDQYGNEIQNLSEEWQNGWQNRFLTTSYFSNINRRDSVLGQFWNSTEWVNSGKTAFFYNQQNQFLESFLVKIWTGTNWVDYLKREITNDSNGNQILQSDQLWNGNIWENSIRRFFTYDGLNYTLTAFCELWNGNNWYLDNGDIIINNPDGFRIGFITNSVSIYYNTTGVVDEVNSSLDNYNLYQNYPNPFNSTTTIKCIIPYSGDVSLKVFDLLGNEVAILIDGYQESGSYEISFNADNLSSGIYFYQLNANDFTSTKKLILLK